MSAPSVPGPTVPGRTGATDALRKPVGVLTFLSWHVGASISPDLFNKLHEYATRFEVDIVALHTASEDAPNLEGFDVVPPDRPSVSSTGVLLFKRQGIKDLSLHVFDTVSALRTWRSEQQPPLPGENAPRLSIIRLHEPPPDDDLVLSREKFVYTPQGKVSCELWPPRVFRTIGPAPAVMLPLGDSILFGEQPALMLDVYCESWDTPPPGFNDSGKFPKRARVNVPTLVSFSERPV